MEIEQDYNNYNKRFGLINKLKIMKMCLIEERKDMSKTK